MARPAKIIDATGNDTLRVYPGEKPNVKVVHMAIGLDLIGSKTSVDSRRANIYERENSLLIVSKETGRKVVIPFANIRGYELL